MQIHLLDLFEKLFFIGLLTRTLASYRCTSIIMTGSKRRTLKIQPSVFYYAQKKNNAVVKISLPEDNKTIFASEYKLYLPTE
ncbi:hypothetical protein [Mucilaginibacter sp.]